MVAILSAFYLAV